MNYEFRHSDEFLIIKLSGPVGVNERLMIKNRLTPHLQELGQKIILDLEGLSETEGVYISGVLNTIKKELDLSGCKVMLCGLNPELDRYFKDNRLDQIFEISQSTEQAIQKFRKKNHGG